MFVQMIVEVDSQVVNEPHGKSRRGKRLGHVIVGWAPQGILRVGPRVV
jgi:hypothetical protein